MVSTHLKNVSQIGNLPQIGVKIKNIWNHHLVNGLASLTLLTVYRERERMKMIGLVDRDAIHLTHKISILDHFFGPLEGCRLVWKYLSFFLNALFVFLGGWSKIIIASLSKKKIKGQQIQFPSFMNHFPRGLLLKHSIVIIVVYSVVCSKLGCGTHTHISQDRPGNPK